MDSSEIAHRHTANNQRVLVAMSGGVDSTVAASLLKDQGYQVTGLMFRLWNIPGAEEYNKCCTPDAVHLARRVAAQLGIPFYVIDTQQPFRDIVVQSFIDGYKNGITPNPCYICNQKFRWTYLLRYADSFGIEYIATGHYAKVLENDGVFRLDKGIDESKDQTYMLAGLNQQQLSRTILPLGTYLKKTVRKIARDKNLLVANKPDSQDLCFLGNVDYRQFLANYDHEINNFGQILDVDGKLLGEHKGLAYCTIGQRKGLGLSGKNPLYVINKDLKNNILVVGEENELGTTSAYITDINWLSGLPKKDSFDATVKIRYKANYVSAHVIPIDENNAKLIFFQELRDITPGQVAVIYDFEEVVCGGTIISKDDQGLME